MTEPRNASERLDELAAVTKEYASYSSKRSGLACVAAGAGWVATFVIALRSETWGRIAALGSPVVVIGLLVAARRYYQRFGRVLESDRSAGYVRWRKSAGVIAFLTGGVVVNIAMYLDSWSGDSELAYLALMGVLATAPAVPLLSDRFVLGWWDDMVVLFSVGGAHMTAVLTHGGERGWILAKVWLGWLAATGAALIGIGVHQHLSYRRLVRRLATLKGGA